MTSALRAHGRQAALVVVLLACLSTVAFGGGYRASQALLDDGAAWLVKGRTVAHVNGDTGRPDAEVARELATGRQRLEVVRTDTGVYVVNNDTGTVTRIETDTMDPGVAKEGTPRTRFVAGGGSTWVVDTEGGRVEQVDPTTLQPTTTAEVPAGVADAVADDDGALWVVDRDGGLLRVQDGRTTPVGQAGSGALLTVVGGRPVVVDPRAGTATRHGRGGAEEPVAVLPLRGGRPELAVPGPGPVLYVALEGTGELVAVDLDRRTVRAQTLAVTPVTDLGRPVVSRTRVAVPDHTGHRLLLVALDDLRVVGRVPVPTTAPSFQVAVQGDRFYATDPYRRTGVVVEADGRTRPIDKGEGHGVEEPAEQAPPPATVPDEPPSPAPPPPPRSALPPPAPGPAPALPELPAPPVAGPLAPAPESSSAPSPAEVEVPDVVGSSKEQACATLERAGLGCRLEATGTSGDGRPGEVVSTDPRAGARVAAGTEVVVRHLGDTTVPDVVRMTTDEACAELERSGLVCQRSADGSSAPRGERAFVVSAQDPRAGSQAEGGSRVTVSFPDKVTADDYVGRPEADACAAVRAVGLRCQLVDGGSNARTGVPVGQVTAQDPAGGTDGLTPGDGSSSGDVVRLTRYTNSSDPRTVGSYTGRAVDQACAAVQADGFACDRQVRRPFRQPGVAHTQSPAAGGTAEAGSTVTVYYDDRAPSQLKRWKKDDEAVWVISADPARPVPSGYKDLGQTDLGLAYPPQPGDTSGLVPIVSWQCGGCGGHSRAHYYGTGSQSPGADWSAGGYAGWLFASEAVAGQMRPVHRLRRDTGTTVDFAYAVPGTGEWDFYTTSTNPVPFRDDGRLGWTWNP